MRPEPVPVTASTTVHPIKNTATARISAALALISRNFLGLISQKTGAARLLFRVPALHVRHPAFSPGGEGARRFGRKRARPNGRACASAKPPTSMPKCARPSIATAICCSRSGCRVGHPERLTEQGLLAGVAPANANTRRRRWDAEFCCGCWVCQSR